MTREEILQKLQEITATKIGNHTEMELLGLIRMRTELEQSLAQKEQEDQQQEKQAELEAELQVLESKITGERSDEELLQIIQERKRIEAELKTLEDKDTEQRVVEKPEDVAGSSRVPSEAYMGSDVDEQVTPSKVSEEESIYEKEKQEEDREGQEEGDLNVEQEEIQKDLEVSEVSGAPKEQKIEIRTEGITLDMGTVAEPQAKRTVVDDGRMSISKTNDQVEQDSGSLTIESSLNEEYQEYLRDLRANPAQIATFLQSLPAEARRNRVFMLQVARIDPAFAMHYADKNTLQKDPSFALAVAKIPNTKSGNPLSEMSVDVRTGQVVLIGTKNNFRNVRFAQPNMPEYDEIIAVAKQGTREAVQALKGAHKLEVVVPAILQKDQVFMDELRKIQDI